jgi:hypothetical protein
VADTAFIDVGISVVEALIAKYSPDLLRGMNREPFTRMGRAFVGQLNGIAECWVGPMRTAFGDEGQLSDSASQVTVTIGVGGTDPEELVAMALDYVRAVHEAIASASPAEVDVRVRRIFVGEHDYGPLWGKQGGFAVFPQIHVVIDQTEVVG